jgi:hypothetical protein
VIRPYCPDLIALRPFLPHPPVCRRECCCLWRDGGDYPRPGVSGQDARTSAARVEECGMERDACRREHEQRMSLSPVLVTLTPPSHARTHMPAALSPSRLSSSRSSRRRSQRCVSCPDTEGLGCVSPRCVSSPDTEGLGCVSPRCVSSPDTEGLGGVSLRCALEQDPDHNPFSALSASLSATRPRLTPWCTPSLTSGSAPPLAGPPL